MDDHHGVSFPWLARSPVANTTPQVDDLLASVVHTAGAAEFVAPSEVVLKGLAHGLKPGTDVSLYQLCCDARHGAPTLSAQWQPESPRVSLKGGVNADTTAVRSGLRT